MWTRRRTKCIRRYRIESDAASARSVPHDSRNLLRVSLPAYSNELSKRKEDTSDILGVRTEHLHLRRLGPRLIREWVVL